MLYEIFVLSQLWSHMMDDLWIIKKYIFENIQTKVCCKHQMAKLGEKKKKKKKPGGVARGVTNIKVYNLFIPFQVPKY